MSLTKDAVSPCAYTVNQWVSYFHCIASTFTLPDRYELDDCVQECCVELSELMQQFDPTDPDFAEKLKVRVFRRLIDMRAAEFTSNRDCRITTAFDAEAEETMVEYSNPARIAEANDLRDTIASCLTTGAQRSVWQEMIAPSAALAKAMQAFCKQRRKNLHDMPVSVFAEATGLSIRQVRHAMERIRFIARQLVTEGVKPCLC